MRIFKLGALALILSSIFLSSCGQDEMRKLEEQNRRLASDSAAMESTINEFIKSFGEIESNLKEIKEKENYISSTVQGETSYSEDVRARIKTDIALINDLMEENKNLVSTLKEKERVSNSRIYRFKKLITQLEERVATQEKEVATLKGDLAKANFTIEQLQGSLSEMELAKQGAEDALKNTMNDANSAYYITGAYKELNNLGVLRKEGGVLFFGRRNAIQNELQSQNFKKIDMRSTKSIYLNVKKAELETTHDPSSYEFKKGEDGNIATLEILDIEKFWNVNNYLIIVTK